MSLVPGEIRCCPPLTLLIKRFRIKKNSSSGKLPDLLHSGILPFLLRCGADQKHAPAHQPPPRSGTEGCLHLISCYQPFTHPVELQLGKSLQIWGEIERNTLPSAAELELPRAHLVSQFFGRGQVRPQDMKVSLVPQAPN